MSTSSTNSTSSALITIKELVISYGLGLVAGPLSFSVKRGECLWIKGANGSGKTGLLRSICGIDSPARGEIYLNNQLTSDIDLKKISVMIGEKEGFCQEMPLRDIAIYESSIIGASEPDKEDWVKYGLWNFRDSSIFQLSLGQRRRFVLMLRLSLLCRDNAPIFGKTKHICLLDEPENGLDEEGKKLLYLDISKMLSLGVSAIIASHSRPNIKHSLLSLS